MTLPELKTACQQAGLSIYGNKDELIERLQAKASADLQDAPDTPAEELAEQDANPEDLIAQKTTATMQSTATMNMVADDADKPVEYVGGHSDVDAIHNPAYAEPERVSRPMVSVESINNLVSEINRRYGDGLKASYDAKQEMIVFNGGLQRTWCTTVHQPFGNILSRNGKTGAADQYYHIARTGTAPTGTLSSIN